MAIKSLFIINKSGGLIYQRNFENNDNDNDNNNITLLNSNDYLILASTLHSVFAISSQLTPKALQLTQSNIDYTIPYIPNIGITMNNNDTTNTNTNTTTNTNTSPSHKNGSFKGNDFFKESFLSWNKSGIRQLSTDQFTMFIYQSMTGLKFITISSSIMSSKNKETTTMSNNINTTEKSANLAIQIADNFLRKIYCLYSDYVMKNPFYSLEMPIKSELFDKRVKKMVDTLA